METVLDPRLPVERTNKNKMKHAQSNWGRKADYI